MDIKKYFVLLCLAALTIAISSCKKNNKETAVSNTDTTGILRPDVHIIDSTTHVMTSDSAELSQGIYTFTTTDPSSQYKTGDVIVGQTNGGYIRVISSVTGTAGSLSFATTQGSMDEVFNNATFGFSLDLDSAREVNRQQSTPAHGSARTVLGGPNNGSSAGYTLNLTNIVLYQDGPLTITLTSGQITLNSNWQLNFAFNHSGISQFQLACQQGSLTGNFDLNISAAQSATIPAKTVLLKELEKEFVFIVPVLGVPVEVPVTMDIDFSCIYSATVGAKISRDITLTTNNTFNFSANYANGQWQNQYNFTPVNTLTTFSSQSGSVNASLGFALESAISFKLYEVAGPYGSITPKLALTADVASPSLDWDLYAGGWIESTIGAKAEILGKTLADYSKTWETDTIAYISPDTLKKISGDLQSGQSNQTLTQPLIVQVVDSRGATQSNVPVYFNVTAGGGSITPSSILTDDNGYAQASWTLGAGTGNQTATATAVRANQTSIINAPVTFSTQAQSTNTSISGVWYGTYTPGGPAASNGNPVTGMLDISEGAGNSVSANWYSAINNDPTQGYYSVVGWTNGGTVNPDGSVTWGGINQVVGENGTFIPWVVSGSTLTGQWLDYVYYTAYNAPGVILTFSLHR
jgi:hypothetical protein